MFVYRQFVWMVQYLMIMSRMCFPLLRVHRKQCMNFHERQSAAREMVGINDGWLDSDSIPFSLLERSRVSFTDFLAFDLDS